MDDKQYLHTSHKIPLEWINRIFERLESIYQDKWRQCYGNKKDENLYKIQWCTGLHGLTVLEIKNALLICESMRNFLPPTSIEFFHYAKGIRLPVIRNPSKFEQTRSTKEVAQKYLQEIKDKLTKKIVLRET